MTAEQIMQLGIWVAEAIDTVKNPTFGDVPVHAEMSATYEIDGVNYRVSVAKSSFYEDDQA